MEDLPDAVYFKDCDSKFLKCNVPQARNLGVSSPSDVIGKSDADFYGPLHAQEARRDELKVMREKTTIDCKLEKVDLPDGRVVWHSTSKAPVIDDNGEVVGVFGVTRDVTESKETQEALDEANRTISETSRKAGRSEIASIVIHNVGNILNSVNVTASMIDELSHHYESLELNRLASSIRSSIDDQSVDPREYLKKVAHYLEMAGERYEKSCSDFKNEVERLQQDVSSIQRIIMLQQDMVSFWNKTQYKNCESVISDALEINKIALQRHGVECVVDTDKTSDWLVPEFQTLQILLNFLSNGKYAFDGSGIENPQIHISTSIDDDKLLFRVADNGPGIDDQALEKIFDLGYTTREKGHGIGLHSSLMAAKEVDGDITGHSEGSGKGACFVFGLPLSSCSRND